MFPATHSTCLLCLKVLIYLWVMAQPTFNFAEKRILPDSAENWRGFLTRDLGGLLLASSPQALIVPLAPHRTLEIMSRVPESGLKMRPDVPMYKPWETPRKPLSYNAGAKYQLLTLQTAGDSLGHLETRNDEADKLSKGQGDEALPASG